MSEKIYNKLVRDNILSIIQESGRTTKSRKLYDNEYLKELKIKLQEEVSEFLESDNIEELADIMEVIEYLYLMYNSSLEQVMKIKQEKKEKRGGFDKRLFLESVFDEKVLPENNDNKYLGIDVHLNRLTVACIDEKLKVISIADISIEELDRKIEETTPIIIAVDAPYGLNKGLMNNEEFRHNLKGKLEGHYNKKVSEYMLSMRGINPFSTPGDIDEVTGWNSWMHSGFDAYQIIEKLEYMHMNEVNCNIVDNGIIETFPHGCFTVLAGHIPQKKSTDAGLEERIQLLDNLGFKNIRSLLHGSKHGIGDKLDALVAAYTALMTRKGQVTFVGEIAEGQIVLPIPSEQFKEKYKRQKLVEKQTVTLAQNITEETFNSTQYKFLYTNADSVMWFKYFIPLGHACDISRIIDLSNNPELKVKASIMKGSDGKKIEVVLEAMKNRVDGLKVVKEYRRDLVNFWGSHGDKKDYEVVIKM